MVLFPQYTMSAESARFLIYDEQGRGYAAETFYSLDHTRPSNFYSLVGANDSTLCETALNALNKSYLISDVNIHTNLDMMSDFLLNSDIHVEFSTLESEVINYAGEPQIEVANIDMNNNGTTETVFRQIFSSPTVQHTLYFNDGTAIPNNSENSIQWEFLLASRFINRITSDLPIVPNSPTFDHVAIRLQHYTPSYFFEIVKIEDRYYVLTTNNLPRDKLPQALLIEVESQNEAYLKCHFQSNYILLSERTYLDFTQ